ncbi:DUF411 domain-containing protein [Luteimonas arsenica]|uniref:DUF411 domain-containing protein n=1 Tax=Luteimonas arsenica TaxID=1586242 RepID=UPI001FB8008B|nr:DUF411 domain-containing protein [Luteimonas arsenica]
MNNKNMTTLALLCTGALLLVACSPGHSAPAAADVPTPAPATTPKHSPAPRAESGLLVVHKNVHCGCCVLWIEHMQQAGFAVEVHDHDDMGPIKQRVGVPYAKGSCHTAEIDGYFVEGHVPAEDVKRLLAERPDARGITVPGMPAGSPGMEMPDGTVHPYSVELVHRDGSTREYARHGE